MKVPNDGPVLPAQPADARKPWFVYPLLAAAVLAVASAGPTFASMQEISPFLLSGWRLSITAVVLLPFGLYQILKLNSDEKLRMLKQSPLLLASGFLLCLHYGAWVESIDTTSLPHAILTASTSPIIIAFGTWLLRKPISYGELIGTLVAIFGLAIMTYSNGTEGSEKEATVYGDMMGLAASFLFVLYLLIGRSLRKWMPIFAYVLPVNIMAAMSLLIFAILVEGANFDASRTGIFGQFPNMHYLWRCSYLAVVPGILGHVSFNALLKWLHPLIIALPTVGEAPAGVLIGLTIGAGSVPGLPTYIGGSVLLTAMVVVILCSYRRETAESEAVNARIAARTAIDLELVAAIGDVPYRGIPFQEEDSQSDDLEEANPLIEHKR